MMEICLVQKCHILQLKKEKEKKDLSIHELSCECVWLRFYDPTYSEVM